MRFPAAPVLPGSEEDCTVAGRRRKDASDPAFRRIDVDIARRKVTGVF